MEGQPFINYPPCGSSLWPRTCQRLTEVLRWQLPPLWVRDRVTPSSLGGQGTCLSDHHPWGGVTGCTITGLSEGI